MIIFSCQTLTNEKPAKQVIYILPKQKPPDIFMPFEITTIQDAAVNYQGSLLSLRKWYEWYNTSFNTNYYKIKIENTENIEE